MNPEESDSSLTRPVPSMTSTAAVRCFIALLLSHLGAPYAAARVTIHYRLAGNVESFYAIVAAFALIAGATLAFRQLVGQPPGRKILYSVTCLILWVGVAFMQIVIAVDSVIPSAILGVLWAIGTLWVPWSVWAFSLFRTRGIVVGSLIVLAGASLFWGLIDITGLTGDARVEFAWKKTSGDVSQVAYDRNPADIEQAPTVWNGYLGTSRNGTITDVRLSEDWSESPPVEIWRVSCGTGWSSFAATESTLFTQEQINDEDCVTARAMKTGELIWVCSENRPGFRSGLGGNGPRATPTIFTNDSEDRVDDLLLAIGPTGLLRCLNMADGSAIWTQDTAELFPGENLVHGVCGSPLIVGSLVIVSPSSPEGPCLAAFEISDGRLVWQTNAEWRASYSSPTLMTISGRQQIVLHAGKGVLAVDPADGTQLWQFEWTNEWDNNATQPLKPRDSDTDLIIATGYRGGAVRLTTGADPADVLRPQVVWETTSSMKTKFCNMAQFGDVVVGLNNGILCGVDIESGLEIWKEGRFGHGQLLQAGPHLLVIAERGTLHLLKPDRSGHHPLGSYPALDRKTWNHPILVNDRLIVRNDQEIVCLQLKSAE